MEKALGYGRKLVRFGESRTASVDSGRTGSLRDIDCGLMVIASELGVEVDGSAVSELVFMEGRQGGGVV